MLTEDAKTENHDTNDRPPRSASDETRSTAAKRASPRSASVEPRDHRDVAGYPRPPNKNTKISPLHKNAESYRPRYTRTAIHRTPSPTDPPPRDPPPPPPSVPRRKSYISSSSMSASSKPSSREPICRKPFSPRTLRTEGSVSMPSHLGRGTGKKND